MISKWWTYYAHVKDRLTLNRGFVKGAVVVARLFIHFKLGRHERKYSLEEPRPSLAFYPHPAGPWYNIWLVLQNTTLKITTDIDRADYVFIFDDRTHSDAGAQIPDTISAVKINDRITDISKKHVGQVFESVFDYGLEVDPTTYEGKVVEKSDDNGTHDGRLITCPIAASEVNPAASYQKFVDSSFSGETCEDLRSACVFGEVAAVFHKHKAFDKRFGTDYLSTTILKASDVFSDTECAHIAEFCDRIGLDFGAIDIMRDKHDGKIYIVDVNKTCMPVLSLPFQEQYRSLAMIADVFEKRLPKA